MLGGIHAGEKFVFSLFPPHLVTNEVPFLLIVILPQETGLVRREVHGALRRKPVEELGEVGISPKTSA